MSNLVTDIQDIVKEGGSFEEFKIHRLLGSGGFAKVYLATQVTMQRLVALKVSLDEGDEAKTLAQLDHPNIVRVFDVRFMSDQKIRLLSMQYVPGGTLADVIRGLRKSRIENRSGKILLQSVDECLLASNMPAPEESSRRNQLAMSTWGQVVCDVGIQLSNALEYAHGQRILHRDLKPANILLTAEGICKLADFNVSYSKDLEESNPSAHFGGSLLYMSPEQLRVWFKNPDEQDDSLDGRSDVYSLAIVLWELLTGERPWPFDPVERDWDVKIKQLLDQRMQTLPVFLENFAMTEVESRIRRCLSAALVADRDMRTSSARSFANQLRRCRSPEAWKLLHPEEGSWSRFANRYPTLVSLLAIFVPNGLAGMFNYQYNLAWLGSRHMDARSEFVNVSIVMNVVSFGMGAVFYFWLVGPVAREVSMRLVHKSQLPSARIQDALLLGHTTSKFGLALWLVAGLIFPLLLWFRVPGFDHLDSLHFFLSLAVCGVIAVSFPFLWMSLITLKSWYGTLIGTDDDDTSFSNWSKDLLAWCDRYLLAATSVPLAGLALLLTQTSPVRNALLFLVAASAAGLFLAFRVHRRIHQAVEILGTVMYRQPDERL